MMFAHCYCLPTEYKTVEEAWFAIGVVAVFGLFMLWQIVMPEPRDPNGPNSKH